MGFPFDQSGYFGALFLSMVIERRSVSSWKIQPIIAAVVTAAIIATGGSALGVYVGYAVLVSRVEIQGTEISHNSRRLESLSDRVARIEGLLRTERYEPQGGMGGMK